MKPLRNIYQDYRQNKFADEVCSDWGSAFIYRPPGMVLAWLLTATPVTPNLVTATAAVLLPIMILAAATLSPLAAFCTVIALAIIYLTLDCTDGTLARATGLSSVQGHYWDLVADVTYRGVIFTTVGFLADHLSPWSGPLSQAAVLALSAWMAVVARLARYNLDKLTGEQKQAKAKPRFTLFSFLSGLDTVFPILAAVALAAGHLSLLAVWIFVYSAGDMLSSFLEARARFAGSDKNGTTIR